MSNPYAPPQQTGSAATKRVGKLHPIVLVFGIYSAIIAFTYLPPFFTRPMASWGWQNWTFAFIPAAYVLFAAVIAFAFERFGGRSALISLPIVLLPLLAVTVLILFASFLDLPNVMAGKYSLKQTLQSLILASFCPVVWCYLFFAGIRSMRMLKSSDEGMSRTAS